MGFDTSMGEAIQQLLPDAFVVKCFNTVGYTSMVDPQPISGIKPDMYIAGSKREMSSLQLA
jgi:predicted dinucleotide-binding enzyme